MAQKTVEPHRSGTRSLRGVARHFVRKAVKRLAVPELSDSAVHEARKDLKKTRAAVRLLRKALGGAAYRRENEVLRDAAHSLNAARDAKVLAQALESLRKRHRSLRRDAATLQLVRALRGEQSVAEQQLRRRSNGLLRSRRALEQVSKRADHWPVGKHGWSALGPALKRIYKSGRRAVPAARGLPPDVALHEWRKQVKYLRYALQMLAPMRPQELPALAERAQQLSDCLGEAHDLSLLAQKAQLLAHSGSGPGVDVGPLLQIIQRRHDSLALNALVRGEQLYQLSPRALDRRLQRYWRKWRKHPKSVGNGGSRRGGRNDRRGGRG